MAGADYWSETNERCLIALVDLSLVEDGSPRESLGRLKGLFDTCTSYTSTRKWGCGGVRLLKTCCALLFIHVLIAPAEELASSPRRALCGCEKARLCCESTRYFPGRSCGAGCGLG